MGRFNCAVPLCRNFNGNGKKLSYHSFPKSPAIRSEWIRKIRRDLGKDFKITTNTKVCSEHFIKTDWRPHLHTTLKLLKPSSVPSVFSWNKNAEKEKTNTSRNNRRIGRCNTTVSIDGSVTDGGNSEDCEVEALVDGFETVPDLVACFNLTDVNSEEDCLDWQRVTNHVNSKRPIIREPHEIKARWVHMRDCVKSKVDLMLESNTKPFDEIFSMLPPMDRRVLILMKDPLFISLLNSSNFTCPEKTGDSTLNSLWDVSQSPEHISVEPTLNLPSPVSLQAEELGQVEEKPTSPPARPPPVASLLKVEFSRSQRNMLIATYLGFEYLAFRSFNGLVTWRCRQSRSRKCHSFMKTKDNNIAEEPTKHSHCPQKTAANVARSKMRQDMKVVSATPRNVMENVLSGLSNDVLAHAPKHSSIIRSLLNRKPDHDLLNPKTINFYIPEKYKNLILHDSGVDDPDRILVLGDTDLMLELNKDIIYGYGTYDKGPNMCYELFTWHAKVGNLYPPCVYVLLHKKSTDNYNGMFGIMKLLIPNMSPQKLAVDFDFDLISAARIAFPDAEVKGCYFHLCHKLRMKIFDVGLKNLYECDLDIKLSLKSIAALAFVPIDDVKSVFNKLVAKFSDVDSYNEVLHHFEFMFIEGVKGRGPLYPVKTWNYYDAALEYTPDTSTCCEVFHNTMNSIFHCKNPSMLYLFDRLQKDLACHKLTLATTQAGCQKVKKTKYEGLYNKFVTIVQQYEQMEDKLDYLRKLANLQ